MLVPTPSDMLHVITSPLKSLYCNSLFGFLLSIMKINGKWVLLSYLYQSVCAVDFLKFFSVCTAVNIDLFNDLKDPLFSLLHGIAHSISVCHSQIIVMFISVLF